MNNMGTDILTRDQMLAEVASACKVAEMAQGDRYTINLILAHFGLPVKAQPVTLAAQIAPQTETDGIRQRTDQERARFDWERENIFDRKYDA